MERRKKDWMKTVGKQRDGREGIFIRLSEVPTNELHKYLYLYLSVLCVYHHTHLSLPDWDLQGDHSLLHTNNLCGIDPYSRKVYYLDDPVHLLVSCAKLCLCHGIEHQVFGFITGDYLICEKYWSQFRAPLPNWFMNLSMLGLTSLFKYNLRYFRLMIAFS